MNGSIPGSGPLPIEWACLHLPADLALVESNLAEFRTWLLGRGAESGEAMDQVMLAVTEALTNSIRHGAVSKETRVRLAWCWSGGDLEVEVSEPGFFAPVTDWGALPEDLMSESGRGGFLISRLMDSVEHHNSGGRHALRLRKRLPVRRAGEDVFELEAMTEELGNAYETISALFYFAGLLAKAPGLQSLAEMSFERLGPLTGANAAWVRLLEVDGSLRLLAQTGGAGLPPLLPAGSNSVEMSVVTAARERTLARRSTLPPGDPLRGDSGCAFVCPFSFEGRMRGVLTAVRADDIGGFFTAGQIGLVRTLADFLGIACGSADLDEQRRQAERAARQLEFAEQIQRGLLPHRIRSHPHWRVYGVCDQAAEVGGDFFDVIDLPDGRRLAVIADVMGKGMPAALLAASLRSAFRAHAPGAADPAVLLNQVNRQLGNDLQQLEMFITAQVVELAAAGGTLAYASAGHCPILLLNPGPEATWCEDGGLPLGVDLDEAYEAIPLRIQHEACLLLMTDGVIEHEDAAGRQLGRDGVAGLLGRCAVGDTARVGPELLAALQRRGGGQTPRDDCTLVAITLRPCENP